MESTVSTVGEEVLFYCNARLNRAYWLGNSPQADFR